MRVGEIRNVHKTLIGKPEGKRPLEGGLRCRYQNNNKIDLKEIRCDIEWIDLAQN
jgi:hypothetical protein